MEFYCDKHTPHTVSHYEWVLSVFSICFLTCSKPLYDFCVLFSCCLFFQKDDPLPAQHKSNSREWNRSSFSFERISRRLEPPAQIICLCPYDSHDSFINDVAPWSPSNLVVSSVIHCTVLVDIACWGIRQVFTSGSWQALLYPWVPPPLPLCLIRHDSRRACIHKYKHTYIHTRICNSIFALTLPQLPTHTQTHTHTYTLSAAHLTTLASTSAKHKRATPRSTSPKEHSVDHMTGTWHNDYLLMYA